MCNNILSFLLSVPEKRKKNKKIPRITVSERFSYGNVIMDESPNKIYYRKKVSCKYKHFARAKCSARLGMNIWETECMWNAGICIR